LVLWRLQRASDHGTNGPQNVVPSVALVPKAWSYARAPFHTGKWGFSATMELLFILVGTTRSSSTIAALVPSPCQTPHRSCARLAPRAATGRRVRAREHARATMGGEPDATLTASLPTGPRCDVRAGRGGPERQPRTGSLVLTFGNTRFRILLKGDPEERGCPLPSANGRESCRRVAVLNGDDHWPAC